MFFLFIISEQLSKMLIYEKLYHVFMRVFLKIWLFDIFFADTGGGNALNVQRTVKDLIAAGAAGCFLEVKTIFKLLVMFE